MLKRLVYSLSFMIFIIVGIGFNAKAEGRDMPQKGEILTLFSHYSMSVPASILGTRIDETGNTISVISFNEEDFFADNTKFAFIGKAAVGKYGDSSDNIMMPLVFVNPVKSDGTVDTSVTYGFPAQFLQSSEGKNVYDYPKVKSHFDGLYQAKDTTFEKQKVSLEEYLSFLVRTQNASIYDSTSEGSDGTDVEETSVDQKIGQAPKAPPLIDQGTKLPPPPGNAGDAKLPPPNGGAPRGPKPEVAKKAEVAKTEIVEQKTEDDNADTDVSAVLNYNTDPRFRNVLKVRLNTDKDKVIVRNTDGKYNVSEDYNIEKGDQFIPIPWETKGRQKDKNGNTYRLLYKMDRDGNILSTDGKPVVFLVPESQLEVYDSESGSMKVVDGETKLFLTSKPKVVTPSETPVKSKDKPVASVEDDAEGEIKPSVHRPVIPAKAKVEEPEAEQKSASPKITIEGESLSICKNQNFAKQLSAYGEECKLVEMKDDFNMVKSHLIALLKGNVSEQNSVDSVLLRSGVIAVDKGSNMCSKVDITYDSYVDDSRAQQKIDEYKKNMSASYKDIVSLFHKAPSQRLGAAFASAPTASRYTYSCDKDKSNCRFSYDYYNPEKLPFVREMVLYADVASQQERIKVYGPSSEDKYLIIYQKGAKDTRAIVLQDDPGVILNGEVGSILKKMKAFEKDYPYKSLKDVQDKYQTEKLQDEKKGYFINSSTLMLNDKEDMQSERLGTKEAFSMINKLRTNKTFYEFKCVTSPFEKSKSLPKWDNSQSAD